MPSKLPSRLAKSRHGTNFVFRFAIPRDLRARIGRNEVRLSLRTEVKLEAIIASHRIAAQLPALFSHLRSMSADPDPTETLSLNSSFLPHSFPTTKSPVPHFGVRCCETGSGLP